MPFELFHRIADPGSARARQFVVEHQLEPVVAFRNVAFAGAEQRLAGLGGDGRVPALWDGVELFVGADAVMARLRAHLDVGRYKVREPPPAAEGGSQKLCDSSAVFFSAHRGGGRALTVWHQGTTSFGPAGQAHSPTETAQRKPRPG